MEIMKYFFSKNQHFLLLISLGIVEGSKLKDDIVIDIGVWLLALKSQYRSQVGERKVSFILDASNY